MPLWTKWDPEGSASGTGIGSYEHVRSVRMSDRPSEPRQARTMALTEWSTATGSTRAKGVSLRSNTDRGATESDAP